MNILVSGLINIETNIAVHNFPIGYVPIEYAFHQVNTDISGVAYNVIKALSSLGDSVIPVSIIGRDMAGRMITDEMKLLHLNTECLFERLDKTCTSAVLFDDNGQRKIYCDLKDIQDMVVPYSDVKNAVSRANGLVICNINFNDEIIRRARECGKPIFTDVHILSDIRDEYNSRFLSNADVVFLSDEGINGNHEDFLISLWNVYHNRIIVLGQGSAGAMLLDGAKRTVIHLASVKPRPVVNTVGAGDALFSSFVHWYLKGYSPKECLKRAVTFAGWKIGESGGAKGFVSEMETECLYSGIEYSLTEIKSF